tara:strand:+ start:4380 stop:6164 length:1785 start_codon:yes stop_codon:yes gene_type:complete
MTYFRRDKFSGLSPAVAPRLLADQFGQSAQNIDFESGSIVPIKVDLTLTSNFGTSTGLADGSKHSIYLYTHTDGNNYWLQWNNDYIKVVEGPIPGDSLGRLYWTGETYPKMSVASVIKNSNGGPWPTSSYRLGIPAPAAAPSVTISGTQDNDVSPEDASWVYTFVSAYGEEGPPSPATTAATFTPSTQTATFTNIPNYGGSGQNFGSGALKRIYRSNTGSTNTQFQFVKEIAYATTSSVTDQVSAAALGEVLPSETWIEPPNDDSSTYPDGPLQGLIPVANGVFAGFTGKRLCFSEAYMPHAWPVAYRITIEEDIVAIGSTSNGVVCLTNGKPYFVTGVEPSVMTAIQIDLAQACVNKYSVVDMGDYLLYAGQDGLCAISGSQGEVVTNRVISPAQWNSDYYPTAIKAFKHEGTYVAFWIDGDNEGGWVFDPRNSGESALSTITIDNPVKGGWYNSQDGELYIISGSSANEIQKYRGGATNRTALWKSKKYVVPKPISMAWVHMSAASFPNSGTLNKVRVWADGTLLADYTISYASNVYTQITSTPGSISNATLREPVMRLPSTLAKEWEVEVSGVVTLEEVCLSQNINEIKAT